MIDGIPLVDAHVHAARLPTLKPAWRRWADDFGGPLPAGVYDDAGTVQPAGLAAHFADEGVDAVLLFTEYSPKVTGIQPVEDVLPLTAHDPARFKLVANLNPHYHHPIAAELEAQLAAGAVALKLHPVHGGFAPTDPALYPAYEICAARGVPVVFHSGTSTFPGSTNRYADPVLVDEVLRDVPGLTVVLAHGGRGWWYDAAAWLALSREQVWIDLAGLPPRRLPDYYARHSLPRLARSFIFGTDWPGVPGVAANARAVMALGLPDDVLAGVLGGHAAQVYGLTLPG